MADWDGSAWSAVAGASSAQSGIQLNSVLASGPHDVWAVGSGAIFHYGK